MKSITKTKFILFSVLTLLILTVCNAKQDRSSNNSLEVENKKIILDNVEIKNSGDNEYTKVWDTGTTSLGILRSFCTGDQDSDGKDEIIAVSGSGFMYVLEYNATYNNYSIVFKSEDLLVTLTTVCCGDDLDKDGKKEIFVCGLSTGQMFVFEHNGNDNGYDKVFQKHYGKDGSDTNYIEEMWIGNDLDNDGEKELIVGAGPYVNISEFNGVGDVYDDMWVSVKLSGIQDVSDVFSGGDLDGDGKKEIIASTYDKIFIFENSGNNSYEGVWNRTKDYYYCVCLGNDLDGDGRKEIIAGTGGTDKMVFIYEYNGTNNGYEEVWNSSLVTTIGDSIFSVCVADDLDGDGKKEIIAGSGSTGDKLYIFEFNGTDNGYSKVWDSGSTIKGIIYSICIGDDFDSNGKKEIITCSTGDGKVNIFEYNDASSRPIIIIEDDDDDDDDDEERSRTENIVLLSLIIGSLSILGIITLDVVLRKEKR